MANAYHKSGRKVEPGETLTSFRGEAATFRYAQTSRGLGKVTVDTAAGPATYYPSVFDLEPVVELTGHQRAEFDALHHGFGTWDRSDADDVEMLEAIVSDLKMFAEGCDTAWITPALLAEWLVTRP